MSNFHLKIVTPSGVYREEEVELLNIVTPLGQTGILANHMPLASPVEISRLEYVQGKDRYEFAIGGGFVYVEAGNKVTVIGNSIESKEEIDLQRAEEAKMRAENRLKTKGVRQDLDIARAEIALKKAIIRINVKNYY
ncbi:MAG: ATP synthase F1 subunit epsilon [Erysipelotrichaceae bacterium]|nr:ATP synthase F1 subunit epsilon [Erysipelotrichaceae bacterium]